MANNFTNVHIRLTMNLGNGTVSIAASFDYRHKDGGNNGVSVVDNTGRRFIKWYDIKSNTWLAL